MPPKTSSDECHVGFAEFHDLAETARTLGIHLKLDREHMCSQKALDISGRYLRDMILSWSEPERPSGDSGGDVVDEENEEQGGIDDDHGVVNDEATEIVRPVKRAFESNPVCTYCDSQFNPDENPEGSCVSHDGESSPSQQTAFPTLR